MKRIFVDVSLFGISKVTTPFFALMICEATSGMFVARKSRPERVTRTLAALSMAFAFWKPAGRGVVPHPEHPLEHPPPLHDATRSTIRIANRCRHERSMGPPNIRGSPSAENVAKRTKG